MARTHSIEVTFFDELTFQVDCTIGPAEPDVGIMSDYIAEWVITEVDDSKLDEVLSFFNDLIQADPARLQQWEDTLYEQVF